MSEDESRFGHLVQRTKEQIIKRGGGLPRESDSLSEAYRTVLDCIVPYCTAEWQMSLTLKSCHDRTLYGGKLRAVNNELV